MPQRSDELAESSDEANAVVSGCSSWAVLLGVSASSGRSCSHGLIVAGVAG